MEEGGGEGMEERKGGGGEKVEDNSGETSDQSEKLYQTFQQ